MPITRKKKKSISVPEQITFDTSVSMETEENDIIEDNEKPAAAESVGAVLEATATSPATLAHNDSEQENEEDMVTAEEMVTQAMLEELENAPEQIKLDIDSATPDVSAPPKKERKSFRQLVSESFLVHFFTVIYGYLIFSVRNSFTAFALTSEAQASARFNESALSRLLSSSVISSKFSAFKRFFRRKVSESLLLNRVSGLGALTLRIPVRAFGIFLLSLGLGSVAVYYEELYFFRVLDVHTNQLLIGTVITIISLFLLPFKCSLADFIRRSVILKTCIFSFLGNNPQIRADAPVKLSVSGLILLGLLFAASTVLLPLLTVLLFFVVVIYTLVTLKSPETGLIGLILIFPFIPHSYVIYATAMVWLSFILKLMTGRRTLHAEYTDIYPLLCVLVLLFAGVVSFGQFSHNAFLPALYCSVYLLIVCIVRSTAWFRRCIVALTVDSVILALFPTLHKIPGNPFRIALKYLPFSDSGTPDSLPLGSSGLIAFLLAAMLFFQFAVFLNAKKRGEKTLTLLLGALMIAAIVLCMDGVAAPLLILTIALFAILVKLKTLPFICALAFLSLFLPVFGLPSVSEVLSASFSQISERSALWINAVSSFGIHWFTGSGLHTEAAQNLFDGIKNAADVKSMTLFISFSCGLSGLIIFIIAAFNFFRHCFSFGRSCSDKKTPSRIYTYAGMCSAVFFIVSGFFENTWFNFRSALLFWIVVGVTAVASRAGASEELSHIDDDMRLPEIETY